MLAVPEINSSGVSPGTSIAREKLCSCSISKVSMMKPISGTLTSIGRSGQTDCRGRGIPFGRWLIDHARTPGDELAITLVVALTRIDRAEVIPDPHDVGEAKPMRLRQHQSVGVFGRGREVAALVEFEGAEQPIVIVAQREMLVRLDPRCLRDIPELDARAADEITQRQHHGLGIFHVRAAGQQADQRRFVDGCRLRHWSQSMIGLGGNG